MSNINHQDDNNKLHDALEELYKDTFIINNPNSLVYHYTNYNALVNILDKKEIWFTDYQSLNDSSEIIYAYKQIVPIIFKLLPKLSLSKDNSLKLENVLIDRLYRNYRLFIFSSCLRENYLPAWRWYGQNGTGFSLGFYFKCLNSFPSIFHQNKFMSSSARVHYNLNTIEPYLEKLFETTNKLIPSFSSENRPDYISSNILCYIIPILPLLKHAAYQEENEYRLFCLEECFDFAPKSLIIPDELKIWTSSNFSSAKFVATVPRIKIEFIPSSLIEVWVGPKCNFEHAEHELNLLLEEKGFSHVKIKSSNIPYR